MTVRRDKENRIVTYTGTVHWSRNPYDDMQPACGATVRGGWQRHTLATVTCKRCIAQYGYDATDGIPVEEDTRDPNIVRREQERAARQLLRSH